MNKKVLSVFFKTSILLVSFAILSCGENSGLGASIDTEAPKISISYPLTSSVIRDSFVLYGTWEDDKAVSKIDVSVTNTATREVVLPKGEKQVTINPNNTWQVELNDYNSETKKYKFLDGTYQVTLTAYDEAGHSSGELSTTFDIDNTPPVFIINKPGVVKSEGKKASAYGSLFTINGTISDDHTISLMDVKIYNSEGNLVSSETYNGEDIDSFREEDIATAGGTSVTIAQYAENVTSESPNENQRYHKLHESDSGTEYYYAEVTLYDSAKVYKTPTDELKSARSATELETDSLGNPTSTLYLYDDVYQTLMRSVDKGGKGLSAADIKNILNGTTTNDEVLATLNESQKDTAQEDGQNRLYFSLNPDASPTYVVSGYNFYYDDAGTAIGDKTKTAIQGQGLTVAISAGLDGVSVYPSALKVWLKQIGSKNEGIKSKADVKKLVSDLVTAVENAEMVDEGETPDFSKIEESGWTLLLDNSSDDSGSDTAINLQTALPDTITLDYYYIVAVTGADMDNVALSQENLYGFIGNVAGTPPNVTIDSPVKNSSVNDSGKLEFKGTAKETTNNVSLKSITVKLTATDEENDNKEVGTIKAKITGNFKHEWTSENGLSCVYDEENKIENWTFKPSEHSDYASIEAAVDSGKAYTYTLSVTVEGNSGLEAELERSVHVDTIKPQVSISSVIPSVTGYTDSNHSDESAVYVNGVITVKGSIVDKGVGLKSASYKVLVDGEEVEDFTDIPITSMDNFSFTVDTTKLDDAKEISIVVTAEDKANSSIATELDGSEGNKGSSSTNVLNSDGKAYIILQETDRPIIEPTNASTDIHSSEDIKTAVENKAVNNIFASSGVLSATISDDDGVDSVTVELSTDGANFSPLVSTYTVSNNTLSATLPASYGEYYIRITANDTQKLETGTQTVDFFVVVDDGAPSFKNIQPVDGNYYSDKFNVSGTITDASNVVSLNLKDFVNGNSKEYKSAGEIKQTKEGAKFTDEVSVDSLASGGYKLVYVATDKYGQSTEYAINYIVDVEPPVLKLNALPDKLDTNTPEISVDVFDELSGIAKVNVVSIKDDVETEIASLAGSTQKTIDDKEYTTYGGILSLAEGNNAIKVIASDRAGNQIKSDSLNVVVDTVAPTIEDVSISKTEINAEAYTELSDANNISITATLKDVGSGVKYAWLSTEPSDATYSNSSIKTENNSTDLTADWKASLAIRKSEFTANGSAKDGQYTYYIYAQDDAGRISVSSAQSFIVDTTAPEINVFVLKDNASFSQNDVEFSDDAKTAVYTFSGTWKDVQTGTAKLEYKFNNGDWTEIDKTEAQNVTISWNQSIGVNESLGNSISLRATDKAGNISAVTEFTGLNFDFNAPTITRTESIASQTRDAITISGKVSDSLKIEEGKISIKAVKGDSTISATKTATTENKNKAYSYSLTIPANDENNGEWTISFSAEDYSGQKTNLSDVVVTLDTKEPTLGSASAKSSDGTSTTEKTSSGKSLTYFNGTKPIEVTIEATDSGVGLSSVEYNIVKGHVDSWNNNSVLNEKWASLSKVGITDNWKATIVSDFASLEDGDYTIFIHSKDVLDNEVYSSGILLVNDTIAPALTESREVNSANIAYVGQEEATAGKFTLGGTLTETNFESFKYKLTVNDADTSSEESITVDKDKKWSIERDLDVNVGGKFNYVFIATDKAGNSTQIRRIISLDKAAPTIAFNKLNSKALSESNQASGTSGTFEGTVSDDVELKSAIAYYVTNANFETANDKNSIAAENQIDKKSLVWDSSHKWEQKFNNIPEGWFYLYVVATDVAGNTTTKYQKFAMDSEAPTSTLVLSAETAGSNTSSIKAISGSSSYSLGTDGKYKVGDVENQAKWNDGVTYISSKGFTLSGTVEDSFEFEKDKVLFYINNKAAEFTSKGDVTASGTDSTAAHSLTWSYTQAVSETVGDSDGVYTYKIQTTDKAGNTDSYSFIVRVDTVGPTINIISPVDGDGRNTSGDLTITGTAFDSGTGVAEIDYTVKNASGNSVLKKGDAVAAYLTTTVESGTWKATAPVTEQGKLTITATAKDYLGHELTTSPVVFTYDNTAPVLDYVEITTNKKSVSGVTISNYNTNTISISAKAKDVTSSVENVTYKLGEEAERSMTKSETADSNGYYTYTATVVCAEGKNEIVVYATDKFSNKTEKAPLNTLSFVVDTTAPTFGAIAVTGASNSSEGVTNTETTFRGDITDATSIANLNVTATLISGTDTSAKAATLPFTVEKTNENKSFSFVLPTNATNGTWEFKITAIDSAGNEQSTTTGILLDTVAPVFQDPSSGDYIFKVGGKQYSENNWYKDSTLSVIGYFLEAATKVGSGISKVEYTLTDKSNSTTGTLDTNKANGYAKFQSEIPGFKDGSTISFEATDAAGNKSAKVSKRLRVDEIAPEAVKYDKAFTDVDKTNGESNKIIQFLVKDADSKLDTSTIKVNIGANKGLTSSSDGVTITFPTLVATDIYIKDNSEITSNLGSYKLVRIELSAEKYLQNLNGTLGITASLNDAAGNQWTGTVATIELDTVAPSVAITSASPTVSGTQVNKVFTITGTASDSNTVDEIRIIASANNVEKTLWRTSGQKRILNDKKEVTTSNKDGTVVYDENTKIWTAEIDTTAFYNSTATADLSINVIAMDNAGNWTGKGNTTDAQYSAPVTKTYTIDQNSDRPLVKVTNFTKLSDGKLVLKYATNAEVTGTISDDDSGNVNGNSVEAVVKGLYVAKAAISSVSSGWTTTTANGVFTATHSDYGTTTLTLSSGDWTYTPASTDQKDGETNLYFYIVDNADGVFTSSNTSSALDRPYWQFKSDTLTKADNSGAIAYRVDGTSPEVKSVIAYSYSNSSGTTIYETDAEDNSETVGTSYVVGGTKKRYAKFVIEANDANGVASMSLTLANSSKTQTLSSTTSGSITTSQSGTSNAVWKTGIIDMQAFGTGEVKLTIIPVDNCSLTGNAGYSFYANNAKPTLSVTTPRNNDEQNGSVTVSGTASSGGNSPVSTVQFVIPPENASATNASSLTYSGNRTLTSSVNAWSFAFDNSTSGNSSLSNFIVRTNGDSSTQTYAVTLASGKISSSTDIWSIPIWFKVVDEIGNENYYTNYKLTYNPNADMPVTTIAYPSQSDYADPSSTSSYAVIGGTIRVNGSVAIQSSEVSVGAVFLQIADMTGQTDASTATWSNTAIATKDGLTPLTATGSGDNTVISYLNSAKSISVSSISNAESGWWGVATTSKSGSWNINLNSARKLDPTSGNTTDIAIRACAVNSAGKMGNWSTPTIIHIDADAPIATYTLKQFKKGKTPSAKTTADAEKSYEAGMYLRNPKNDWYMEVLMADTTGINRNTIEVSGSAKTSDCTVETGAAAGSANNYYIYVPIGRLTSTSFSVSATDNDTGSQHTTTTTFSLNIDNEAPTMGELKDPTSKDELAYTKIRNSNYKVSLSATATDSVSGFNKLAYFFKRTVGVGNTTTTTIELPRTTQSGNNWQAVASNAKSMTVSNSAVAGSSNGTTVGLNSGDEDDVSGLYGITLSSATRSSETSFTHSLISYYAGKGVIAPGSLMRIGGNYIVIKSVDSNTVTFENKVNTNYTSAFFAMAFIVDNKGETSTWDGGVNTLGSDDGDGVYEKLETSSWSSEFASNILEDGPISICCSAFDLAENVATQETKVMITNNTPRLTKVFLATDLNGDSNFSQSEFAEGSVYKYDANETGAAGAKSYISSLSTAKEEDTAIVTVGATGDWTDSGSITASDSVGSSLEKLFRVSDNSVISFEFVSGVEGYGKGNNGITAYMSVGSSALKTADSDSTHSIGDIASFASDLTITYASAKASSARGIKLDKTKFYADNAQTTTFGSYTESKNSSDVEQYLTFTLWDKTKGTKVGVVDSNIGTENAKFGSQYTVLNIPVYFDFVDDTAPKAEIAKIEAATSDAGTPLGHVELTSSLPSANFNTTANRTAGYHTEYDNDPKLSGKVIFSGTVSDNKRINSISLQMAGGNNKEYVSGANNAQTVAAFESESGALKAQSITSAAWKFTLSNEKFSQTTGHSVDWRLELPTTEITSNDANHKWTALDLKVDVTASDGNTNRNTTASQYVDVVPYITGITRTGTTTYRSTYGEYPVAKGDTITITGFNFSDGVNAKPVVKVGSKEIATTSVANNKEIKLVVPENSGELTVTVNSIVSLNDKNDNTQANNQEEVADNVEKSSTVEGNVLYDNRYLRVWDVNHYFKNSVDGNKPTFATDNAGNLFSSWTLMGTASVQMQRGLSTTNKAVYYCYDQPDQETWLSIDRTTNTGDANVLVFPANVGSGGTPTSNGYGDARNIGGAWGISVPNSLEANYTKYVKVGNTEGEKISKLSVRIAGNPYTDTDGNMATAGYPLASYAMRREISQFQNARTARVGNALHYAYYDKKNKALRYTYQPVVSGSEGTVSNNVVSTINDYQYKISGWNLIDGGTDGQDRVHAGSEDIWVKGKSDLVYGRTKNGNTTFEPTTITEKNVTYNTFTPVEGETIGISSTLNGVFKFELHTVTSVNGSVASWSDGSYDTNGKLTGVTVYRGDSNVVSNGVDRVDAAGSHLSLAVTSSGKPVIVYFDAINETLRVAYSTSATPDMSSKSGGADTWTRQSLKSCDVSGGTYVQAKIDGNNYLHIVYRNAKGEMCYIKSQNNPDGTAYKFVAADIKTIDTAGTYGTLSLIRSGKKDTYTYTPCVSFLNSEGTANGVKFAILHDVDTGKGAKTEKWDTMIVPAVQGHYVTGGEYIYTEGYNGWTNTDSVNTADCDAIIAYNTGRMDVLFLKNEMKNEK